MTGKKESAGEKYLMAGRREYFGATVYRLLREVGFIGRVISG